LMVEAAAIRRIGDFFIDFSRLQDRLRNLFAWPCISDGSPTADTKLVQGAVVRPVLGNPSPSAQQPFQDWQMLQQVWDPQDPLPDFNSFPQSSSSGQGMDSYQPQAAWDAGPQGLPQPSEPQDFFAGMGSFAQVPYQV